MERRFVGTKDLAQYLDLSINTVRYWVFQRQIPHHKIGRSVKFDLREIEKWLKDRKINTL